MYTVSLWGVTHWTTHSFSLEDFCSNNMVRKNEVLFSSGSVSQTFYWPQVCYLTDVCALSLDRLSGWFARSKAKLFHQMWRFGRKNAGFVFVMGQMTENKCHYMSVWRAAGSFTTYKASVLVCDVHGSILQTGSNQLLLIPDIVWMWGSLLVSRAFISFILMHQSVWIPSPPPPVNNPVDSDSFLASQPGSYGNGVQTQGQFWHLK